MTFERVCALIESNPELLFGATEAAASVIDRHLLDVGIDKPWSHLNRSVEIEPGPLVIQTPERASMTLDWHAPVDG